MQLQMSAMHVSQTERERGIVEKRIPKQGGENSETAIDMDKWTISPKIQPVLHGVSSAERAKALIILLRYSKRQQRN